MSERPLAALTYSLVHTIIGEVVPLECGVRVCVRPSQLRRSVMLAGFLACCPGKLPYGGNICRKIEILCADRFVTSGVHGHGRMGGLFREYEFGEHFSGDG